MVKMANFVLCIFYHNEKKIEVIGRSFQQQIYKRNIQRLFSMYVLAWKNEQSNKQITNTISFIIGSIRKRKKKPKT